MFSRLPDRMAGYATYELALLLADLTGPQRAAIDRIVQDVYIDGKPWAHLFRGEDRICAETSYYRRGKLDVATGNYERGHRPGWGHDPAFQQALAEARKLALAAQQRERLDRLQAAKRQAEDLAVFAVATWAHVATFDPMGSARNDAAGRIIDLAFKGDGGGEGGKSSTSEEDDWWQAAGGNNG